MDDKLNKMFYKIGDVAEIQVPAGKVNFEIIEITR